MKSIKDLLPAVVEMHGEEMNKNHEYRFLQRQFMSRITAADGGATAEKSNDLFDAYTALNSFVEKYFYERGLRDGMTLRRIVDEATGI